MTYIREHKEVFATVVQHYKVLGFDGVYERMFDHIFDPILDRFNYPKNNRQYAMMYYLNGTNAIIAEWLKNGCDRSIQEITGIISDCVYGIQREYNTNDLKGERNGN